MNKKVWLVNIANFENPQMIIHVDILKRIGGDVRKGVGKDEKRGYQAKPLLHQPPP